MKYAVLCARYLRED